MRNSTELVEPLLNLYGLENSKLTAIPGGRSTVVGARDSNSSYWSRLLSHSGRTTQLHGAMETRHAILHSTTIHTSPRSHNREQARSETIDTISHRHSQHLSSFRTTHDGSETDD